MIQGYFRQYHGHCYAVFIVVPFSLSSSEGFGPRHQDALRFFPPSSTGTLLGRWDRNLGMRRQSQLGVVTSEFVDAWDGAHSMPEASMSCGNINQIFFFAHGILVLFSNITVYSVYNLNHSNLSDETNKISVSLGHLLRSSQQVLTTTPCSLDS